jgi:hypothetical protein
MYDFRALEREIITDWMAQFKSGKGIGEYSYKIGGPTSLYGTTDMLISTFILDDLLLDESQRDEWAQVINRFQDPHTGWYKKSYTLHYKEHTSAYAVAALHLIDRKPRYPFSWKYNILKSQKAQEQWIKRDWRMLWSLIWPGSHVISGVPAMLAMTNQGNETFFDWYFDWLDAQADPNSGFYMRGIPHKLGLIREPRMQDLGGAFHMYYVYEWFDRKWPYPEKIVDQCLRLQHNNGFWDKDVTYCIDLDGLYSMIRSSRNANWYRKEDVKQAVCKYLETAEKTLNDEEFLFTNYSNSHRLTGALAAIAECQKWFPELVKTTQPWKQSLDYACYI